MESSTEDQKQGGRGHFLVHHARTSWMLASALMAVVAGIATLNLILTDSGMAILNHHLGPLMAHLSRLNRQG